MAANIYKTVTYDEFEHRTDIVLTDDERVEHDRILNTFLSKFRNKYIA